MKIFPCNTDIDINNVPQLNRFTDLINIYIVETDADYGALPQSIKDMLSAQLAAPDAL